MVPHRGWRGHAGALLLTLLAPPVLGGQVIAPLSTQLQSGAPDSAANGARFDALLAAALTRAGFTLLEPTPTDSAWHAATIAAGGYFDPHTGRVVPERMRGVRTATLAALRERGGPTLLIMPRVVVFLVRHDGNLVLWDGQREKIGSAGDMQGEIPAASLVVIVSDTAGDRVHCGRGGIQLLQKGNFWHAPRQVDDNKILTDLVKDSTAVALALAGLIAHHPSCEAGP